MRLRSEENQRPQRGATLPEYALVLTLIVVASIGAIEFLESEATEESQNQADCIAERPPTASCQIPAIVTTTSVLASSTTNTTSPSTSSPPTTGTTTTTTTTTAPLPNVASWDPSQSLDDGDGTWTAEAVARVSTAGGSPAPGSEVQVEWSMTGQPGTFFQSCTTAADGTCTLTFEVPLPFVEEVTATMIAVNSSPPVDALPGALTFPWPFG